MDQAGTIRKPKRLWSVRHREGWCAALYVNDPGARSSVRTVCQYYIALPWDARLGKARVNCSECKRVLAKRRIKHG